jgi:hypothetical protein
MRVDERVALDPNSKRVQLDPAQGAPGNYGGDVLVAVRAESGLHYCRVDHLDLALYTLSI